MSKQNEHDVYLIPPNFIEGGTVFGGMLKLRNVIEAGIIALIIGFPICMLDISLTAKIVILCLTALPIGIFAVIGIYGEALSSFVFNFFKFLKLRRVLQKPIPEAKPVKTEEEPIPEKPEIDCYRW